MLTVSQGGVDTCLKVIEAHEKDKGFKKALEELQSAQASKKMTDAEVAGQEARLKKAGDEADSKTIRAAQRLQEMETAEREISQREKELEQADVAFKADMRRGQARLAAESKAIKAEVERLQGLDAELKALQSTLLTREEDLRQERAGFEAWRDGIRSALQKPAEVA